MYYQAGAAKGWIVLLVFITPLVLGGGSWTQAQVILTCDAFATAHCGGAEVTVDTLVSGGSASVSTCTIITAGVSLKFKNPGNPAPCLTVEPADLQIFDSSGSRLRIEHTTIVADSVIMGFSVIHVEDSTLSVASDLRIQAGFALFEDSVLEANEVVIGSFGTGAEVTLKGADIRAIDRIGIGSDGASVKVKEGSKLTAGLIEITTRPGTLLAVTGSELTADFTEIGFDGGAGDAVDNIKANTFVGGDLFISCPARVTSNTFDLSGNLSITGSSPCICSKNTPNVVCPTP